uniref:CDT1 Geminin-binding domain-containing protein n=2 Tax=Babesia bovis TaxID=5865 RepID=A7AND0_BABBO|eukprot:XP_001611632.1 hypothetical protein [Babesia bovis T2Bo]
MDRLLSRDGVREAKSLDSTDKSILGSSSFHVGCSEMTLMRPLDETRTTLCESGGGNGFVLQSSSGHNSEKESDMQPSTPKLSAKPLDAVFQDGGMDPIGLSPRMTMEDRILKRQSFLRSSMKLDSFNIDDLAESPNKTIDIDDVLTASSMKSCSRALRTPGPFSGQRGDAVGDSCDRCVPHKGDEYVNISDDVIKNPVLASSLRTIRMLDATDDEAVRSREVLGASRCWTDMFGYDGHGLSGGAEEDYDDILATQTPVRNLRRDSQPAEATSSFVRMGRGHKNGRRDVLDVSSLKGTPQHVPDVPLSASRSQNKYGQAMFVTGNAYDLDAFGGARIDDMRKEDVNPMAYSTLPKVMISDPRMGKHLSLLYKHFKNMATFIRRSSMRNDKPYFKVVQLMVQRMTRKDFTLEHLRQMAWLAPNLISLKWVSIGDSVRRRYKTEYDDCRGDNVNDIQIRIHKLDGRICSSNSDFDNACTAFKGIICAWVSRCEAEYIEGRGSNCGFDPDMSLPIPLVALPTKQSNIVIPDDISSATTSTPKKTMDKSATVHLSERYQSTKLFESMGHSYNEANQLSTHKPSASPYGMSTSDHVYAYENDNLASTSTKRKRDESVLTVTTALLDTPGMWRIRNNAKRLSDTYKTGCVKERDLLYWKGVRRFINALVDLSISEDRPPLLRLEWLAEFMTKNGRSRVTFENVLEWSSMLASISPDTINLGVSKFDDYSTVLTLPPSPRFENAIHFVEQKINTYNK